MAAAARGAAPWQQGLEADPTTVLLHPLPVWAPCLFSPHCCCTLGSTLIALLCFHSRSPSPLQATEKEKESPTELAERCLRELLGRAAYGNIKNAIKPVLM